MIRPDKIAFAIAMSVPACFPSGIAGSTWHMELDTLGVECGAWCVLGGPQAPQPAVSILLASGGWREGAGARSGQVMEVSALP